MLKLFALGGRSPKLATHQFSFEAGNSEPRDLAVIFYHQRAVKFGCYGASSVQRHFALTFFFFFNLCLSVSTFLEQIQHFFRSYVCSRWSHLSNEQLVYQVIAVSVDLGHFLSSSLFKSILASELAHIAWSHHWRSFSHNFINVGWLFGIVGGNISIQRLKSF